MVDSQRTPIFTPHASGPLRVVAFWDGGNARHSLTAGETVTIGRAEECDLRIDHASVSRKHAQIEVTATSVYLSDLGSSNGTRVAGQLLAEGVKVPLAAGTIAEIGTVVVLVQTDGEASPLSTRESTLPEERPFAAVKRLVAHVARSTISVLVVGETGAGKEVLVDEIHALSPRAAKPLVKLHCASLPESLLEAELFGYERGAFTGAQNAKPGLIEGAHGGTLFLDEIGELPPSTQTKLLRVLENREVQRLGALRPAKVDLRFIAATHRDLHALVAKGTFREDLFFRLDGVTITIPPLRDRKDEIPTLAQSFAALACEESGKKQLEISSDAMAALRRYAWPGNVRELRHVIERAVVFATGDAIMASHLPAKITGAPSQADEAPARESSAEDGEEREKILAALARCGGNQREAAAALGISRRTLLRRLDSYAIVRPRKR